MKKNIYLILLFSCLFISSKNVLGQSKSDKLGAAAKVNSRGMALKNSDTTWSWLSAEWFTVSANSIDKIDWIESNEQSHDYSAQAQLFLYYQNRNRRLRWENQAETGIAYKQSGDKPGVYSADKINALTKLSYRTSKKSKFSYSMLLAVNTTFLDVADSKGNVTKGFFEPGTLEFGPGINFLNKKATLSLFFSPATKKTIYVIGDGPKYDNLKKKEKIKNGENYYREFGTLINATFLTDISPKLAYTGNYDFYSDYLHNPENIFINLRNTFRYSLSQSIALTWSLNYIYDDHLYAGSQLKSELGVGFNPKILTKIPTKFKK
jgi:hypothetical protein